VLFCAGGWRLSSNSKVLDHNNIID
jgi:hypothetical protein